MIIDLADPAKGRHVFDWHPRPWGKGEPSPVDLKTSHDRDIPGVIKYGRGFFDRKIYQGVCKSGAICE